MQRDIENMKKKEHAFERVKNYKKFPVLLFVSLFFSF